MKKSGKIFRRAGMAALIALSSVLVLFVILIVWFSGIRLHDISLQKQHLEDLKAMDEENDPSESDQMFANFSLEDTSIRLNEIRMVASHNS